MTWKLLVALKLGEPLSKTRTVTVLVLGPCASVGVQAMAPAEETVRPVGPTVSSAGAIAWTPTEAQGPSTNTVTVRVFDNGSPSLSATNSFQVIVTEVNTAPVLTLPATQTIPEQTLLSVNATATDEDLPPNTLTFALVSGPTGLTVSSGGAID